MYFYRKCWKLLRKTKVTQFQYEILVLSNLPESKSILWNISALISKGQLNLELIHEVIISPKNQKLPGFLPYPLINFQGRTAGNFWRNDDLMNLNWIQLTFKMGQNQKIKGRAKAEILQKIDLLFGDLKTPKFRKSSEL